VSSSGDGSGSSIGISGWNGSGSIGTCGRGGIGMSRDGNASGSGSGGNIDLSGPEYGQLESENGVNSNPKTGTAVRQQGWFVRRTKLARVQKLRSEKGCLQHLVGELQLVRGIG